MKLFGMAVLLCFLAACSGAPFSKNLTPHSQSNVPEQDLFIAALDQFVATQQYDLLETLQRQSPGSVWGRYAKTLLKNTLALEQKSTELMTVTVERDRLQQENLQLIEKIEQLKTLLIELEQRPQ